MVDPFDSGIRAYLSFLGNKSDYVGRFGPIRFERKAKRIWAKGYASGLKGLGIVFPGQVHRKGLSRAERQRRDERARARVKTEGHQRMMPFVAQMAVAAPPMPPAHELTERAYTELCRDIRQVCLNNGGGVDRGSSKNWERFNCVSRVGGRTPTDV